jgi:hypothetical protein
MEEQANQATMTITFYAGKREFNWQRITKKYLLRNWTDKEHLNLLVDEIAHEMHYLSGYGIKAIKLDSPQLKRTFNYESQFPPYPKEHMTFFYALQFELGWTDRGRKVWFDLPRIDVFEPKDPGNPLFPFQISGGRRGRRRVRPQVWKYNRDDPRLVSFLQKISADGVLTPYTKTPWHHVARITTIFWGVLPKTQTGQHIWTQNEKKAKLEERKRQRLKKAGIVYKGPKKKEKTDQIYIIQMDESEVSHVYKIGVSNAPGKRLQALQTSNPFELRLVHTFVADPAEDAEAQLHARFAANQLEGEWFRLTPEQIAELQQIVAYKHGEFIKRE